MARRPPLEIGTYGKIRFDETAGGWRARTQFRDYDGHTRPVERTGKTKGQAERRLKDALRDRIGGVDAEITRDTKLKQLAEEWFRQLVFEVEQEGKSPNTTTTYRSILDRHVLPGLGELRVHEAKVSRIDKFLEALIRNVGPSTAKTARSALSGMLKLAARYDAIGSNPTRDTRSISATPKKKPRALTTKGERNQWLAQLEADEKAVRWDLPELTRFMLATGVRVGEALAVHWEDVDLDNGVVDVAHTVVRVQGKGLIRKYKLKSGKRSERELRVPSWAVTMLRQRWQEAEADGSPLDSPVFPDTKGGLRDPNNVLRVFREVRGKEDFAWVTSHTFRKTTATALDDAKIPTRRISDQLGHSQVSMTQDHYLGRASVDSGNADALEDLLDNESDE